MTERNVNQTLVAAVTREMPAQPPEARAWFILFRDTAIAIRDEMTTEFGTDRDYRPTIRALDRIISHYRVQ